MYATVKNSKVLNQHTRRLANNVFGALLSRFVNLGSTLLIVPLAIKSLGTHDYGIFAVILSAVIIFSYSDLGLGLAVVNRVASAKDEQSLLEARDAISNVWHFLVRVSAFFLVVGILAITAIKVTGLGDHVFAWDAWLALIICAAFGLAPGLTQRILFGLQRNLEANLWNTAGRIFSVIGVYLAYFFHMSMPWFIIAMVGLPAIVGWLSTLLLWRGTPQLKPNKSAISWSRLSSYMRGGLQFLFLQVGVFFETGVDNILIGSVQGTQFVTNYDLLARLFIYVPALISMLAFPLWPAISHANASGDDEWVRWAVRVSFIGVALVSILSSGFFLYLHADIIHLWVGVKYQADYRLAMALAAFAVLTSLGTVQVMFMSGLGFISDQVRILAVFLLVLIPGKFLALSFSGQTSMVWTLVLAYALRMFSLWFMTKKRIANPCAQSASCLNTGSE